MAIRASPLMGLGALLQGYDQQRQEDQRRRVYEEQLRQAALLRASQGAIGATLTAPGGIGGGVGSSPYAGLANLAGGGQPPLSPAPLSAPDGSYEGGTPSPDIGGGAKYRPGNVSIDNIGLSVPPTNDSGFQTPAMQADFPSSYGTTTGPDIPGDGVMPQGPAVSPIRAGQAPPATPQQQAYQQPPGAMRNLMPMRPGVPGTLDTQPVPGGARPMPPPGPYLGTDGQLHPPPLGMGGAAARPPVAPQQVTPPQRPPMAPQAAPQAQPSPAQGGGQQQPFNPADLLNPERGLEFASNIAQRVKAANPNASNEVIAQATVELMKAVAGQDRVGLALALANMKNVATGQRQQDSFAEREKLQANTLGAQKERQQGGFAEREKLQQTSLAARKQLSDQKIAAMKERWGQIDTQREQVRKDAIRRGDATAYRQSIRMELQDIQSQLGNQNRITGMDPDEKAALQQREQQLIGLIQQMQTKPQ